MRREKTSLVRTVDENETGGIGGFLGILLFGCCAVRRQRPALKSIGMGSKDRNGACRAQGGMEV